MKRPDLPLGFQLDKKCRIVSYKAVDADRVEHWREYLRDDAGNVVEYRDSEGVVKKYPQQPGPLGYLETIAVFAAIVALSIFVYILL